MKVFCLYCFDDSVTAATVTARHLLDAFAGGRAGVRKMVNQSFRRPGGPVRPGTPLGGVTTICFRRTVS
jgi:hypothetical protein